MLCWLALAGVAQAQAPAPKFDSRMKAEMALHENIWGNDEEFTTHTRGRVPPSPVDPLTGLSGPVRVEVSVMIEKVKIDTVLQVATIKWWLRQSWTVLPIRHLASPAQSAARPSCKLRLVERA